MTAYLEEVHQEQDLVQEFGINFNRGNTGKSL
jgi:hypothetical protein